MATLLNEDFVPHLQFEDGAELDRGHQDLYHVYAVFEGLSSNDNFKEQTIHLKSVVRPTVLKNILMFNYLWKSVPHLRENKVPKLSLDFQV